MGAWPGYLCLLLKELMPLSLTSCSPVIAQTSSSRNFITCSLIHIVCIRLKNKLFVSCHNNATEKSLFCFESNLKAFLGRSPHSIQASWLNISITQSFHTSRFQAAPYSWNALLFCLPSYLSSIIQIAHAIPPPRHSLPELFGKGLIVSLCTIRCEH